MPLDKGVQVLNLLVEGVGIRAISRLTGLHQQTVLNIIEVAGHKCAKLLDQKIRDVAVDSVQCDELWAFVYCKNANNHEGDLERGDQYTFLAIDRKSKLVISHWIGKRTIETVQPFIDDVKERVRGKFQLTTDSFVSFVRSVYHSCNHDDLDYAVQQKVFRPTVSADSNATARRYSPGRMISTSTSVILGNPDPSRISTSHVERTNLTVRLFNRKCTRLTLGYAKTLRNFQYCQAIFIAHFNFCRLHSAHGQTPAQAAGLTSAKWATEDLLTNVNSGPATL